MKIIFFDGENAYLPDQKVPGLGYIQRNGSNFLPALIRLEELLSGTLKTERRNG